MNLYRNACQCMKMKTLLKLEYNTNQVMNIRNVSKHFDEILQYYSHSKHFLNNIQYVKNIYLKRTKEAPDKMLLVDKNVAQDIVGSMKADLMQGSQPIFEVNPGLGLITEELVGLKLQKIRLFENDPAFRSCLQEMCNKYGDQLKIYNTNLLELWKIDLLDEKDKGGRLETLMEDVTPREWADDISVKIICILGNNSFIRSITNRIMFENSIIAYGRPQLFILASPILYCSLKHPSQGMDMLFNIIFDWLCISTIDEKALLPWMTKRGKTTSKLNNLGVDPAKFYLLKVEPKSNLNVIIPKELMKPLWYFTKVVIRNHRIRIVPSLEKWIPDCGPRLLLRDINCFTEFGQISPQEVLNVFLDFVSWPEFGSCPFLTSMEDYLMKVETESYLEDMRLESESTSVNNVDAVPLEIDTNPQHEAKSKGV